MTGTAIVANIATAADTNVDNGREMISDGAWGEGLWATRVREREKKYHTRVDK